MPNFNNYFEAGIVIPCYNEGSRLDLDLFKTFLKKHTNVILLFVNDGSQDNTEDILSEINNLNNTKVINFKKNRGKAKVVQTGINTFTNENINIEKI